MSATASRPIDSAAKMSEVIRRFGVIPFFKGAVPGWSVEELTAPGCWFDEGPDSVELGPWDWKIDVVREGDIAYGKFLGGKAAFATVPWYLELMNWRRSLPRYRMALGEPFASSSKTDSLFRALAPEVLGIIREEGAVETGRLRSLCGVKKNVMDSVIQFLQSGTWTVTGDLIRVYRGPDLHYNGWQRALNTTPDALFASSVTAGEDAPFWVRRLAGDAPAAGGAEVPAGGFQLPQRSPEASRALLISHVREFFPDAPLKTLERLF